MPHVISYLLFDLGNVLVHVNNMPWLRRLMPGCSDADVHQRWVSTQPVVDFESGRISPDTFFTAMPGVLGIDLTPDAFADVFSSWVPGEFDGASTMICDLRRRFRVGCLSNTNPCHVASIRRASPLMEQFDDRFLSYETGWMKPSRQAYIHVMEATRCRPEEIWFFDDSSDNIATADALGWHTTRVNGLDEVEAALEAGLGQSRKQQRTCRN